MSKKKGSKQPYKKHEMLQDILDLHVRGFCLLLHAHDKVWNEKRIDLKTRVLACDILWSRACVVAAKIDKLKL